MKLFIFIALLSFVCAFSRAQFPARTPSVNDTLVSPKILSGNRVMFQIYAPKASEVTVGGDIVPPGEKSLSLTKAGNGVWSAVTRVLTPDVYGYTITVDGVKTLDPKNGAYEEGDNSLSNIFELPGTAAAYLDVKNVPHGKVEIVWFPSATLNNTGRMRVYTPPGYEKMTGKLPVLYLQHGGGENDASWTTNGKANFILDNLLADGKIKPMIVVMPMGHPSPGFHMEAGIDAEPYYKQLFNDIIPYVESHYNASSKRDDRAFAGLSMGGIQALNVALFRPEMFAYVLPLSTGYFPAQLKDMQENHSDVFKNPEINKLKLFWIAMGGEKDIAYQNGKNLLAVFDKYGIKYQTFTYPAGHTFVTWRHDLYEFAPLLFR